MANKIEQEPEESFNNRQTVGAGAKKIDKRKSSLLNNCLLLGVGVTLIFLAWTSLNKPLPSRDSLPPLPQISVLQKRSPDSLRIFQQRIEPIVVNYSRKNDEAAQRAIQTVKDRFQKFRGGVAPFVEEMTEYGTRFGILKRIASDKWDKWWNKNDNAKGVATYVNEKYRKHVMSEEYLKSAMADAITVFSENINANRNKMLSEMDAVFSSSDFPVELKLSDSEMKAFITQIGTEMQKEAKTHGENTATAMIVNFVGSSMIGFAAERMVADVATSAARVAVSPLIPQVVNSVTNTIMVAVATRCVTPTTALVGGGVIASTSAIGGEMGAWGGPVGVVVGFGIGAVIGGLVDWWMEKDFKIKMTDEMTGFLNSVEDLIIYGKTQSSKFSQSEISSSNKGLLETFREANWVVERSFRESTTKTMIARAGQ